MKSKKKRTHRSNKRYLFIAIIALLIYQYGSRGTIGPNPTSEKSSGTHRLLVFVDVPVVANVQGGPHKALKEGLREWLIPSLVTDEQEEFSAKELYIFSLCSSTGVRSVFNYHLDKESINKLSGRGFRGQKMEEFNRKYRQAFRDQVSTSEHNSKYRHILPSTFTIRDYVRNYQSGDLNSILYYSDLMQTDVRTGEGKFNFAILNAEENGSYTIKGDEVEMALEQLRDTTSQFYKNYIQKMRPIFSKIPAEDMRIFFVGTGIPHNPSPQSQIEKEDVRQFWVEFFEEAELIKMSTEINIFDSSGPWGRALNGKIGV